MIILMLGAPGSGKGTHGKKICERYNLENLATGDIFRDEIKNKTELGEKANEYISRGQLVPDEITIKMVEEKLNKTPNVLLDGFPRTIKQANALEEYLKKTKNYILAVINLNVLDDDLVVRTSSRVICSNKKCGASFNTKFFPSKVDGICDVCGSELIKRADDEPETIRKRLKVYHESTEPLLEFYKEKGLFEQIEIDIYDPMVFEKTVQTVREKINRRISEKTMKG